ncbi:MAG: DUF4363 family protein [Vallitalea sp.]|nr:DUF4363 family protein [Vallitalea sp.]
MKKIFLMIITFTILSIFVIIMNSGRVMKKSFGNTDNVDYLLQEIDKDIIKENWDKGLEDIEKLEIAWKKVEKRVQFSVERDDLNEIILSMSRLKGSIRGMSQDECFISLEELKTYWNHLEE